MSIFADTAQYGDDITLGQVFAAQQVKPFTEGLEVAEFTDEENAPSVSVNLPANADVTFNFVPDLSTQGEFTDFDDLGDTVKADPYSDTMLLDEEPVEEFEEEPTEEPEEESGDEINPEEGDIESTTDSDEARFLTLQDLM